MSPISIKLRPEERAALLEAADEAGVGPSTYAADAVRTAIGTDRVRPPPKKADELTWAVKEATGGIGRIGNILNQLAKAANCGRLVDERTLYDMRDRLASIDESLGDAVQRR